MVYRMKGFTFFLSLFLLLSAPQKTFAWGSAGHRIIAEIAFRYLDDQTKKNVLAYLNGMSPEEASNWMDEMRSDHAYDYMKPYHYADFDRGQPATNITGNSIIGVLNATLRELDNPKTLSTEQIRTDLLYLMHLVGDIHQPLHIGYADDRGGNEFQVSFMGNGSNLHKVWDSEIIEYKHISLQNVISANSLSPEQIRDVQKIDIVSWANQSRGYLDLVYSIQGHKMDEAYIAKVYPVIEKQLFNAGIRLAAILELYFGHMATVPKPSVVTPSATITPAEASSHVGQTLTVCGKVFGGKYLENSNGSPTLINMGADYPDNPLTLVIYGSDRGSFSYKPEEWLPGKTICVTGLIKLFKGEPEIVVTRQSQIQIR
jgi:S1/P1 Nuclease